MPVLTTLLLAVGVNQSVDPGLALLHYAESDAEKFAHVIEQVAENGKASGRIARSPSLADFRASLDAVARESVPAQRLVFYFSGHADDRGLHFRDGFLPRDELHAWLDKVPAKTKLVVIDACFSGSLATKGAEAAPAFELPQFDLDRLTGTVFLTAASSRDVAFESQELGGSVFTHFVVRGLGGAADLNADSLVTVEELYQYTYREMQLRNLGIPETRAQRPEFHAELHGKGAMVVSWPKAARGSLTIDPGILGTIQLGSLTGLGTLNVYSGGTKPTEVPLPAGQYRAVILRGSRIGEARVEVGRGPTRLLAGDFQWHDVDDSRAYSKGGAYSTATVTALLGMRLAADRVGSMGPELELAKELGYVPGAEYAAKTVALVGMRQLHGETPDERLDTFSGSFGLGLSLAPSSSDARRLLVGLAGTAEWQEWESSEGEVAQGFTPHPTLILGLSLDLAETPNSKNLALRYDSDYVTDPASGSVRRRDSYLLGVGFKP